MRSACCGAARCRYSDGGLQSHTFRAASITAYLDNGGSLRKRSGHGRPERPRTTKLYDRTDDQKTLG